MDWKNLPKETREMTSFLNLVLDETIELGNEDFVTTYIRCFGVKCHGIIETAMNYELDEVHWRCTKCSKSGVIRNIFGDLKE
ncbi:MAG: hypothetical protein PHN68_01730 [Prolixibacteraceae bacterium]|jgi:hypothetical protein|nr:hypothetical protein [Prolixibacteraceae bacterium]NLO01632.1 hypothetical protein [Bacteroidales bacterium]